MLGNGYMFAVPFIPPPAEFGNSFHNQGAPLERVEEVKSFARRVLSLLSESERAEALDQINSEINFRGGELPFGEDSIITFDYTSLDGLLTAHELSNELKTQLGEGPEQFMEFFSGRGAYNTLLVASALGIFNNREAPRLVDPRDLSEEEREQWCERLGIEVSEENLRGALTRISEELSFRYNREVLGEVARRLRVEVLKPEIGLLGASRVNETMVDQYNEVMKKIEKDEKEREIEEKRLVKEAAAKKKAENEKQIKKHASIKNQRRGKV